MNYVWAPSSLEALGLLIWCCRHSPSSALGFAYCLNECASSCFRLSLQRMISAKFWEVNKLQVAQRRAKEIWEE